MMFIPSLTIVLVALFCSVFGCAMPFAAVAALAASNLPGRAGIAVVLGSWLINQLLGFTIHHYPRDASTFAWGLAMGVAAFAAYALARIVRERPVLALAVAFVT